MKPRPDFGRYRLLLGPVPCHRCGTLLYLVHDGARQMRMEADRWLHTRASEEAA